MLANGVKETTATTGTGTVTLSAAPGFVRFSQAFVVGEVVSYAIQDGNNREWGIGTIGASNTLTRNTVTATLVSGTYTADGSATAITLSGSGAEVICTPHAGFKYEPVPVVTDTTRNKTFLGVTQNGSAFGTAVTSSGRSTAMPFWIPRAVKMTELACETTVGLESDFVDVGIYANKPDYDHPGKLLWSAVSDAAFATDTAAIKVKTISPGLVLNPGLYWIVSWFPTTCRTYGTGYTFMNAPSATALAGALGYPLRSNNNANNIPDPANTFLISTGDSRPNPVWQATFEDL